MLTIGGQCLEDMHSFLSKKWTGVGKSEVEKEWEDFVILPSFCCQDTWYSSFILRLWIYNSVLPVKVLTCCSAWTDTYFYFTWQKTSWNCILWPSGEFRKPKESVWTHSVLDKWNKKYFLQESENEKSCGNLTSKANIHWDKHAIITQYNIMHSNVIFLCFPCCKCPPVKKPEQPWHTESCSYTPSNHLWFLVLTKKTHCLSWLCGAELPEMPWFICYVWLQFLLPEGPHSVTTVKAQLLFCSQRIWYPLFDRHSICGNCSLSHSPSVFLYSCSILRSAPSFCWNPNSSANKRISFSVSVPHLAVLSPNCRLDWFHFICYTALCLDKINGLSQV